MSGRPTKFPVYKLAEYLNKNFPHISFESLQHLDSNDIIIRNSALFIFSVDTFRTRTDIYNVFQRDTGKISKLLLEHQKDDRVNEGKNVAKAISKSNVKLSILNRILLENGISKESILCET